MSALDIPRAPVKRITVRAKQLPEGQERIISNEDGPDSSFEVISVTGKPRTNKWVIEPMYRRSLVDKDIYWQIGFDPELNVLRRWYGQVKGKIQTRDRDVETNTSGRNIQEQALLEARRKHIDKYREGYLSSGSVEPRMISIMTATAYDPSKPIASRVFVDTKLNGIRLWVRRVGDQAEGFSRGNLQFKHVGHILRECVKLLEYLPPYAAIDGEMFHPDLDFEIITSATRTEKFKHPIMEMLEYHIFDVWWEENPPFEVRRERLEQALELYRQDHFGIKCENIKNMRPTYRSGGRNPELVDTRTYEDYIDGDAEEIPKDKSKIFLVEIHETDSPDELNDIFVDFLERGFEGAMIKKLANGAQPGSMNYKMSQYLFGKGRRVLKMKDVITEEGVCIEVTEATGSEKGCAMLVLRDERDNVFQVRMSTTLEQRKEWFENPDLVLGKAVTFKYQTLSRYGVPIFPVGITVRDYEPGHDGLTEHQRQVSETLKTRRPVVRRPVSIQSINVPRRNIVIKSVMK